MFPDTFNFTSTRFGGFTFASNHSKVCIPASLRMVLRGTGHPLNITYRFRDFMPTCEHAHCANFVEGHTAGLRCAQKPTGCTLGFDLGFNNFSTVPAHVFVKSNITEMTLSHNNITEVDILAFNHTYFLQHLDLSYNALTYFPIGLQENLPLLQRLILSHNAIVALPEGGVRVVYPEDAVGNPLQCARYGPSVINCTCPPLVTNSASSDVGAPGVSAFALESADALDHGDAAGAMPSEKQVGARWGRTRQPPQTTRSSAAEHCEYVRCAPPDGGCPDGLAYNRSGCLAAPFSDCVNPIPLLGKQYQDPRTQTFRPVTHCARAFPSRLRNGYAQAYEYANYTSTSDRLCSICSVCPEGFAASKCTGTVNTQCVRGSRLSTAGVAAVVLAASLVVLIGAITSGWLYCRKERARRELGETRVSLRTTSGLLSDERAVGVLLAPLCLTRFAAQSSCALCGVSPILYLLSL